MEKRELLIILLGSLILIFFLFLTVFFVLNFYDKNSYFSFLEKTVFSLVHKKDLSNIPKDEKFSSILLQNRLSSKYLILLLNLLIKNEAKIIVMQLPQDFIDEEQDLKKLNEMLLKSNNIFFVITINNKKGIFANSNKYFVDKEILQKLYTLPDPTLLYFSNCKGEIAIKSKIYIPENKISFIKETIELFDDNNIDLSYKINEKLIFSLPFLLKLKEENVNLNEIKFKNLFLTFNQKKYYYDQKARMSFLTSIPKKRDFDVIDFSIINEAIESKLKAFEIIKEFLKKEISYDEDLENYIKQIGNIEKNIKLQEAKNLIDKYNTLLNTNLDKIKNRIICISFEKDEWIKIFIFQKRVLDQNINLIRLPLELIIALSIVIFSLTFLTFIKIKKKWLIYITFFSILLFAFITFRIFLLIDLPLLGLFFSFFCGTLCYYLIFYLEIKLWYNEINKFFGKNLSSEHVKRIIELIKTKKWIPEKKGSLATFLYIDLSLGLISEIDKDNIDILAEFHGKLSETIKKYFGIVYDLGLLKKVIVFGNPPVTENHAFDAVNCAKEIVSLIEKSEIFNKNKIYLLIHSKTEWFMNFDNSYGFIGEIIEIFSYMLKYAKRFNVCILITETVFKLCDYKIDIRMLDRVRFTGVKQNLRLFELVTEKSAEKEKLINYFHGGMKLFLNRNWEEAAKYFKQCLKIIKDDLPSEIFLERCKEYIYVTPDPEWDGVYEIDFY